MTPQITLTYECMQGYVKAWYRVQGHSHEIPNHGPQYSLLLCGVVCVCVQSEHSEMQSDSLTLPDASLTPSHLCCL